MSSGAVGSSLLSPVAGELVTVRGSNNVTVGETYDNIHNGNNNITRGNYRVVVDLSTATLNEINDPISNINWMDSNANYNYIDAGVGGLILRNGADTAVQVLGNSNTGSEGNVIVYNDATIIGNLTVNGTINSGDEIYNPYHICGNASVNGVVSDQKGIHAMAVTKSSSDTAYYVTFPAHATANYVVFLSSAEFHVMYRNPATAGVMVYLRTTTNTGGQQGGGMWNIAILR